MCPVRLVSVVDDDASGRFAIENLVRSLGWPTHTFDSAQSYLQWLLAAHDNETGCLISDVRMPGMSGIEMFDRLLALGAAPPTLFMTAFPTDALRAQVTAKGALALLEKPVDGAVLKIHLTRVLGSP